MASVGIQRGATLNVYHEPGPWSAWFRGADWLQDKQNPNLCSNSLRLVGCRQQYLNPLFGSAYTLKFRAAVPGTVILSAVLAADTCPSSQWRVELPRAL